MPGDGRRNRVACRVAGGCDEDAVTVEGGVDDGGRKSSCLSGAGGSVDQCDRTAVCAELHSSVLEEDLRMKLRVLKMAGSDTAVG